MPRTTTATGTLHVVRGDAARMCRPFVLELRVSAPEPGYRIALVVEKGCTAAADSTWKLVFDLFKKIDREFIEIVHVSFQGQTPVEKQGIESIASEGLSRQSARVLRAEVFPIAKRLEGRDPTAEEKTRLKESMRKAAVTAVDV